MADDIQTVEWHWWEWASRGWCHVCHRSRHIVPNDRGYCWSCGTAMVPINEAGTEDAKRAWWIDATSAYCPTCKNEVVMVTSDRGHCWKCDTFMVPIERAPKGYERRRNIWQKQLAREEVMDMATPDIVVDRDAAAYVAEVVQACPGEVGGLGYVEKLDNGDLHVYEFALIEQEADSGSVEFNDDAMHRFLTESGERPDHENLRVSWHSHGNMKCYFSGTDTNDAIKKYKEAGMPWLLSLVFNRKGEIATRLDVFDSSVLDQVYLEDLAYKVVAPIEITEQARKDAKELVHKPLTWAEKKAKERAEKEANGEKPTESDKSTDITVVRPKEESGTQTQTRSPRPNKRERKRLRRSLVARSDFSPDEVRRMRIEEVQECLQYLDALDSGGNGVVRVGDDLDPDPGKSIHELTDAEWVKWCDEQGYGLDPSTRRMLLAEQDDDWGGAT